MGVKAAYKKAAVGDEGLGGWGVPIPAAKNLGSSLLKEGFT
jgi:hypothetical protein